MCNENGLTQPISRWRKKLCKNCVLQRGVGLHILKSFFKCCQRIPNFFVHEIKSQLTQMKHNAEHKINMRRCRWHVRSTANRIAIVSECMSKQRVCKLSSMRWFGLILFFPSPHCILPFPVSVCLLALCCWAKSCTHQQQHCLNKQVWNKIYTHTHTQSVSW